MKKDIIVVMVACLILAVNPVFAECNSRCCDEEYPKITVQGEGKIETMADKAYFNVSLRVEEKKLQSAFEKSSERINFLTETLTVSGVKKDDVRNLGYTYNPLYEGKKIFSSIARPTSYEVVYTLKVTLYNLKNLGKILTALSEVQETSVYGLTYTSTKIDELKREVLKKAASDAHEKALKLAEGSGAVLGKVMNIEIQYDTAHQSRGLYAEQSFLARDKIVEAPGPQVESGYLEVVGSCTVQYAIQ